MKQTGLCYNLLHIQDCYTNIAIYFTGWCWSFWPISCKQLTYHHHQSKHKIYRLQLMIPILQLNIYMVLFMPPSTQRKTKTVMLSTNSNIESRVLLLITDIYLCLCNL